MYLQFLTYASSEAASPGSQAPAATPSVPPSASSHLSGAAGPSIASGYASSWMRKTLSSRLASDRVVHDPLAEVARYFSTPLAHESTDPVAWWGVSNFNLFTLYCCADRLLFSIMLTSIQSYRGWHETTWPSRGLLLLPSAPSRAAAALELPSVIVSSRRRSRHCRSSRMGIGRVFFDPLTRSYLQVSHS